MWNGKARCVGLNVALLHGPVTTFDILYVTKKTRTRSFPYPYSVPTAVVYGCPRQTLSSGITLAMVPLDQCQPLVIPGIKGG